MTHRTPSNNKKINSVLAVKNIMELTDYAVI